MKKCRQGYYYCYTDKKCKRIPLGYRVASSGYLRKENGADSGDNGKMRVPTLTVMEMVVVEWQWRIQRRWNE